MERGPAEVVGLVGGRCAVRHNRGCGVVRDRADAAKRRVDAAPALPTCRLRTSLRGLEQWSGASSREIQAVAICLMTLHLFVDREIDPAYGPALP